MHSKRIMEIPAKYQGKLFLVPKDIMDIFGMEKNSIYEYLHDCKDFRIKHMGSKILIFSESFWEWYFNSGEAA